MKGRSIGHRSQRIVRSHSHIVGLGHGGDLLGFEQTTAVTNIGLDHVAGVGLKTGLNWWRVTSRSPTAIGTLVD